MPSAAIDYTAWPTEQNVLDRIAAIGPALASAIDDVQVQSKLDELVSMVGRETKRQFLPGKTDGGAATATTTTTLQDTTKDWEVNQWANYYLCAGAISSPYSAPGQMYFQQSSQIVSNTANTLTVQSWGTGQPAQNAQYVINEGRFYNGSGTGEMQIDEFIGVSQTVLYGYLGVPSGLSLSATYASSVAGQPNTRLVIARGSLPAFAPIWVATFPEGRRNIQVIAQYGFGSTIPADLWQAVCDRAAQILVAFEEYQISGRIKKWSEENIATEEYDTSSPEDLIEARKRLELAIKRYTRPMALRRRQQTLSAI